LKKLEKADEEGRKTGVVFNTGARTRSRNTASSDSIASPEVSVPADSPDEPKTEINITPSREEPPKPVTKPVTIPPPIKKPESPPRKA
jgi:hypothetical protein